jgi:hypothetical protein
LTQVARTVVAGKVVMVTRGEVDHRIVRHGAGRRVPGMAPAGTVGNAADLGRCQAGRIEGDKIEGDKMRGFSSWCAWWLAHQGGHPRRRTTK